MRELVSKVQTMRKESGFEVTDHILLSLSGSGIVLSAAKKYEADIMADVLADGCATAESREGMGRQRGESDDRSFAFP